VDRYRIAKLEQAESKLQESLVMHRKETDQLFFVVKQREEETMASQEAVAHLTEELR